MRIIIATPLYPPQNGVLALYAEGIARALEGKNNDVQVISGDSWRSMPPGIRHLVYFVKVFSALRDASFVLALDTWSTGFPAYCAARLRGVPFSVRIGGDPVWESYVARTDESVRLSDFYAEQKLSLKERCMFRLIRMLVVGAECVFFNTRFQMDLWQPIYGFDVSKARLLENYYPLREQLNESSRKQILVSAARVTRFKNMALLERAFTQIAKKHPDVVLDTRVVSHEEQLTRLQSAYAVIIPSVSEVGSNTAIEAVSVGTPFIMTDDTGTKERLGECGMFVDTRSEDAVAQAIERMLDPVVYKTYAENAQAFSFVHTWGDMADEILRAIPKRVAIDNTRSKR